MSASPVRTPAAWRQHQDTRAVTRVEVSGRALDPVDVVAVLAAAVGAQQLTVAQAVDTLAVLGWERDPAQMRAMFMDVVTRSDLIAQIDEDRIELDVRDLSGLPAYRPEVDHVTAVRDLAVQERGDTLIALAARDTILRRGGYVLPDASQQAGQDLDGRLVALRPGARVTLWTLFPVHVTPEGTRMAFILDTPDGAPWRTFPDRESLNDWLTAYGATLTAHPAPNEPGHVTLPADESAFAPLTRGGVLA